jgi:xanthine/CO dehydrogenase XdhC/CoxF family maturation factor
VEASAGPLLPLFERERAAGKPLALGVLVHTAGSTYRKPGALILICRSGDYAGLLSGGCLEGDLGEHARSVIDTGVAKLVGYDLRGPEDLLWGLGIGCEGAMQIMLIRVGPESDWQPLACMARSVEQRARTAIGLVTESHDPGILAGTVVLPSAPAPHRLLADPMVQEALTQGAHSGQNGQLRTQAFSLFVLPLVPPPRLLVLGAGPDAAPVVEMAARLSWAVTVVDHRPAYANPAHFPLAERVIESRPAELTQHLELPFYDAAVVMSHHLPSDLAYLSVLADAPIPYVGLLGPAARRDKLLADLGAPAEALRPRLHAPVGLPIGGRTPESIALSIISQVHAFLHGIGSPPARPA